MRKKAKHLVTVADLSNREIDLVYRIAAQTKTQVRQGIRSSALAGRVLGMIFEKPSMRTRISFQAAMIQAGGHAMDIRGPEIGLGKRESVKDVALVMYDDVRLFGVYWLCPAVRYEFDFAFARQLSKAEMESRHTRRVALVAAPLGITLPRVGYRHRL